MASCQIEILYEKTGNMGTIRTLLAISVVFSHSYGFFMVGGQIAVQSFYMISGYLMSFILVEKGSYQNIRIFYANRVLRLFPIYIVVLFISLIVNIFGSILAVSPVFETLSAVDIYAQTVLVITNLLIVGQDTIMFLAFNENLHFTTNFLNSDPQLFRGLLIPQAWTLSLEITFYLIAPFILPRIRLLCLLFLVSVIVKFLLFSNNLGQNDPWSYRFLPAELSFFLAGSLLHQCYFSFRDRFSFTNKYAGHVLLVALSAMIFVYPFFSNPLLKWVFLATILFSLPTLLQYQRKHRFDDFIGELSYPTYICHMALLWPFNFIAMELFGYGTEKFVVSCLFVLLVIVFSLALNHLVAKRVENLRTHFRSI